MADQCETAPLSLDSSFTGQPGILLPSGLANSWGALFASVWLGDANFGVAGFEMLWENDAVVREEPAGGAPMMVTDGVLLTWHWQEPVVAMPSISGYDTNFETLLWTESLADIVGKYLPPEPPPTFNAGGEMVADGSGTFFIHFDIYEGESYIFALDAHTGAEKWFVSGPDLALGVSDGTSLYFSGQMDGYGGGVYAVDAATGELEWSIPASSFPGGAPRPLTALAAGQLWTSDGTAISLQSHRISPLGAFGLWTNGPAVWSDMAGFRVRLDTDIGTDARGLTVYGPVLESFDARTGATLSATPFSRWGMNTSASPPVVVADGSAMVVVTDQFQDTSGHATLYFVGPGGENRGICELDTAAYIGGRVTISRGLLTVPMQTIGMEMFDVPGLDLFDGGWPLPGGTPGLEHRPIR